MPGLAFPGEACGPEFPLPIGSYPVGVCELVGSRGALAHHHGVSVAGHLHGQLHDAVQRGACPKNREHKFEQKKQHPAGVERLIEEAAVSRERTLLVGDSAVDVRTARNAGVRCAGVTYGFQPETLDQEPPDFRMDRMEQVADLVLGESS